MEMCAYEFEMNMAINGWVFSGIASRWHCSNVKIEGFGKSYKSISAFKKAEKDEETVKAFYDYEEECYREVEKKYEIASEEGAKEFDEKYGDMFREIRNNYLINIYESGEVEFVNIHTGATFDGSHYIG